MAPADSDNVTLGEVYRTLLSHVDATEKGFRAVNRRIEGMNIVHHDTYVAEQTADRSRLATLEDGAKWLRRTMGAGMVTLLVTLGGNAVYLLGHK